MKSGDSITVSREAFRPLRAKVTSDLAEVELWYTDLETPFPPVIKKVTIVWENADIPDHATFVAVSRGAAVFLL